MSGLSQAERDRFDALMQDAINALPAKIRALIEVVPIIVLDQPTADMVRDLHTDGVLAPDEDGSDLCGLHSGVGITQRSIEDPAGWGPLGGAKGGGPEQIHIFRRGIIEYAGGFNAPDADEQVYEEVRTTLLHEIGHHFGLNEDDLDRLGYA